MIKKIVIAGILSSLLSVAKAQVFANIKMGAGDFHINDVAAEVINGNSLQKATFKQFSSTPNLGADFIKRGEKGFMWGGGGNFGDTKILPYGKQNVELQSYLNNTIVDQVQVDGKQSYGRLRLGSGFCSWLEKKVFVYLFVTGEYGYGSSTYYNQLFAAYNPFTYTYDPSQVRAEETTWAGFYGDLSINFNLPQDGESSGVYFGFSVSAPRVWRDGLLQKEFTPSLLMQISVKI